MLRVLTALAVLLAAQTADAAGLGKTRHEIASTLVEAMAKMDVGMGCTDSDLMSGEERILCEWPDESFLIISP